MNNIIFFDGDEHLTLLPLTYTKPVSHLRVGILTITEKWERYIESSCSNLVEPYLQQEFPMSLKDDNLFILGGLLPTKKLVSEITQLEKGQSLKSTDDVLIAARCQSLDEFLSPKQFNTSSNDVRIVQRPWDIFHFNADEIENDIQLLNPKNSSDSLIASAVIGNPSKLFIHPAAKVYATSLNTTDGIIYIGENAEVMEGSVIRGPFALCNDSTVKMGSKIYGGTTIGPHSKVGGEVGNSVIQGFSNKGHDGYLGNSVIGEWCNLGADTNTSNLKNNYSNVRVWDYKTKNAVDTGLTFCGLIMGDHSKTGINTMLNTGTVVGVGSNIFGANFPPKFVPSFSWGSGSEFTDHKFEKFCSTAEKVMKRRGLNLSDYAKSILQFTFETSKTFRQ